MTTILSILTIAISFLAVIIAGAQWATHHQRAVLDLFEKRMRTYTALRKVLSDIKGSGGAKTDAAGKFRDAMDEAKFLFGDRVNDRLDQALHAIYDLETACGEQQDLDSGQAQERSKAVGDGRRAKNTLEGIHGEFPSLFAPYMRMTQKTPWWWWCRLVKSPSHSQPVPGQEPQRGTRGVGAGLDARRELL